MTWQFGRLTFLVNATVLCFAQFCAKASIQLGQGCFRFGLPTNTIAEVSSRVNILIHRNRSQRDIYLFETFSNQLIKVGKLSTIIRVQFHIKINNLLHGEVVITCAFFQDLILNKSLSQRIENCYCFQYWMFTINTKS